MSGLRRGICPVCDEEWAVTKAGVMRDHRGDMWVGGRRQTCAGVGQPFRPVAADRSAESESSTVRTIRLIKAEGYATGFAAAVALLCDEDRCAQWLTENWEPHEPARLRLIAYLAAHAPKEST